MTDEEIAQLLRTEAPIVLIEAPAGCGKTYQAATYTSDVAKNIKTGRLLVLTHTHAACSVIAKRTKKHVSKVDIRTLDSFINQIATAYHLSLGLPADVSTWARKNGYEKLANMVVKLLSCNELITKHLVKCFPIVICDEHQDSNEPQDKLVRCLAEHGALLRVFGDPMQVIPGGRGQEELATSALERWEALKNISEFAQLETPHRWLNSNPALGEWILLARESLKNGFPIVCNDPLPVGVKILFAENSSPTPARYQFSPDNWTQINRLLNTGNNMLLLATSKATVQSLSGSFRPRFPIWEGHTRVFLEEFVESLTIENSDLTTKSSAFIKCLKGILVGFSDSRYGNRLKQEIHNPTVNPRGHIPPQLKIMAEFVRAEPNHKGFAKATAHLKRLVREGVAGFSELYINYVRELDELIKLIEYEDASQGFAEITQRRSRSYPKPASKALSTVHKSKGLETENVFLFACDGTHYSNSLVKRNLLYVALSRSTVSVTIISSRENPCAMIRFDIYS